MVPPAFAARGDVGWTRVPGPVAAQLVGAVLAAVTLRGVFGDAAAAGATTVGPGFTTTQALTVEVLATLVLVSTVLGSSSSAQDTGPLPAMAVGSAIALGGLWAGPVSGASMNPARSCGPELIAGDLHLLWIYLLGPVLGAGLAVAAELVLRGPGGGPLGTRAAEGIDGVVAVRDLVTLTPIHVGADGSTISLTGHVSSGAEHRQAGCAACVAPQERPGTVTAPGPGVPDTTPLPPLHGHG